MFQERRTQESPMDWQWESRAPVDPSTPFPQHKGEKVGFATPKIQSSFAAAAITNPATPFRNPPSIAKPSFKTPQKSFEPELFSEFSGAESSPGGIADLDDTPDPPKSTQMTFAGASAGRQPAFGRGGTGFSGSSPGRLDMRKGKFAPIAQKRRLQKRAHQAYELSKIYKDDNFDSESDSGESRPKSRKGKKATKERELGWLASTFHFIDSHPNLPNVLSYYAQLIVNFFIAGLTIFGIYQFWVTVSADINKASEGELALIMAEMAKCARDFVENKCGHGSRLPALEAVCDNWEHCMHQDPNSVKRGRISAHTFAEIFNSFIEPISYKAMIFVVLIVTVCILVNNLAFGMFRSKSHTVPQPQAYFPPPPQQQGHPMDFQYNAWGASPQTPQRNDIGYDVFGQTYQAIMPSMTPQRSPSKNQRSESPSKVHRSPSKGNRSPSKSDMMY